VHGACPYRGRPNKNNCFLKKVEIGGRAENIKLRVITTLLRILIFKSGGVGNYEWGYA